MANVSKNNTTTGFDENRKFCEKEMKKSMIFYGLHGIINETGTNSIINQ